MSDDSLETETAPPPTTKSTGNRRLYYRLNNYDYSDANIAIVKKFLADGKIPADMDTDHFRVMKKQFGKTFSVKDGALYYTPLNLEVVRDTEKDGKMKLLYDDEAVGLGAGIVSFYHKVCARYLNIRRQDVADFLKKQTPYQLTKAAPKPLNHPNIGDYPNHKWAADLIHMEIYKGANKGHTYILTVVDIFSRYVFAVGIKKKTPETLIRAFEQIKATQSQGILPVILIYDNGTETQGVFPAWCVENNIKLVHTATHSPTSNAHVESFNGILRKMIREHFIRTKSLNWINALPTFIENRNNTQHGKTRKMPVQIWTPTRTPIRAAVGGVGRRALPKSLQPGTGGVDEVLTQEQAQREVAVREKKSAAAALARYDDEKFEIGNRVRIAMKAIDTRVRKEIKDGKAKLIPIKYTPDVYYITAIHNPKAKTLQKPQYTTNWGGKRFWGSELQLIPDETSDESGISAKKIEQLNGTGRKR